MRWPKEDSIGRVQTCVLRLPKYWLPTPLSSRRVCPPPATKGGGGYTLAGRRGGGGSIFWKTQDIGLASYSNNLSTLWPLGVNKRHPFHYSCVYRCQLQAQWQWACALCTIFCHDCACLACLPQEAVGLTGLLPGVLHHLAHSGLALHNLGIHHHNSVEVSQTATASCGV